MVRHSDISTAWYNSSGSSKYPDTIISNDRIYEKVGIYSYFKRNTYNSSLIGRTADETHERAQELIYEKAGTAYFVPSFCPSFYDTIIKKVIFNPPATIILWKDGTKTVVKAGDGEIFDPEKGFVMAFTKKILGNQGNYYNLVKKYTKNYGKSN